MTESFAWHDIATAPTCTAIVGLFPDGSTDDVYSEVWGGETCYYHSCNDEYCNPQPVKWSEKEEVANGDR